MSKETQELESITPKMIEAGLEEIAGYYDGSAAENVVARIYAAMFKAQNPQQIGDFRDPDG